VDANSNEPEYFHKFEHLKITRTENGILEVRFITNDGPIVFTGKDHHDFVEAFSQIAQDRDNKVMILTGSGDDFLAQIDGPSLGDITDPGEWDRTWWEGQQVLQNLTSISVPVIAAINGPATVHSEYALIADIIIAATIVIPQVVVALLSPWVGRSSDRLGRRPIMLLGWMMLPLQGLLYASALTPFLLVLCQLLSGVSAAVFGVTMTLVAADLTRESGRFNLTLGALGVAIAIGASISTTFAGIIADAFGDSTAFLGLALAGLAGALLLWLVMPETGVAAAPPPPSMGVPSTVVAG